MAGQVQGSIKPSREWEGGRPRRFSGRGGGQRADELAAKGEEREGHPYRSEEQVLSPPARARAQNLRAKGTLVEARGCGRNMSGGETVKSG